MCIKYIQLNKFRTTNMTKYYLSIAFLFAFSFSPSTIMAHGGGLDSKCGHNCSAKSKKKGLCTAYHYHFGNCPKAEEVKVSNFLPEIDLEQMKANKIFNEVAKENSHDELHQNELAHTH